MLYRILIWYEIIRCAEGFRLCGPQKFNHISHPLNLQNFPEKSLRRRCEKSWLSFPKQRKSYHEFATRGLPNRSYLASLLVQQPEFLIRSVMNTVARYESIVRFCCVGCHTIPWNYSDSRRTAHHPLQRVGKLSHIKRVKVVRGSSPNESRMRNLVNDHLGMHREFINFFSPAPIIEPHWVIRFEVPQEEV